MAFDWHSHRSLARNNRTRNFDTAEQSVPFQNLTSVMRVSGEPGYFSQIMSVYKLDS
jgi:hypothetical protein